MNGAVVAEWAEFLIFHAPGLLALILCGCIISSLAFVAGENNEVTRHFDDLLNSLTRAASI